MGVQGLDSYIMKHSHLFLESIELHDTYLVIDGCSILYGLCYKNSSHCCFGGDYEQIAFNIIQFFDELLKCNIIPVVVIDGGLESKKVSTVYKRIQENIHKIAAINSNSRKGRTIFPMLSIDTFKYIAEKKNITCIYSMYEADNDLALIAKMLNCPVLSSDSDFYLFDVLFIPIRSLEQGILNNSKGYFKQCKIFKSDYLIRHYPLINKSVLPLFAVLLGNDYVNKCVFNQFFPNLELQKYAKEQIYSINHLKIEFLLRWLENHSLNSAITTLLSQINPNKQEKILETIEIVINGYLNLNFSSKFMFQSLNLTEEKISILLNDLLCETYKFEKLDNYVIEDKIIDDDNFISFDKNDVINTLSPDEDNSSIFKSKINDLINIIPIWFLKKYHAGMFPPFFIDIISYQCMFSYELVQNLSYPTTFNISLKILSVIFRLLTAGIHCNTNILTYIARGNDTELVRCELDCNQYRLNCSIPSLEKLEDHPTNEKKQIFINTMGISEEILLKFPPKWSLHIAAIKFWLNEAEKMFRTKYHLYALTLNIIWHVVKEVTNFNIGKIDQINKDENNCSFEEDMSVKDALDKVDVHDCIISYEEFFKSKVCMNMRQFDIEVVHAFSLFQHCLFFCINLSALLGDIYPKCNVAEFFNGVLVYNVFNDLRDHKKLNGHICKIFKKSPSLLQLFVSISKILV